MTARAATVPQLPLVRPDPMRLPLRDTAGSSPSLSRTTKTDKKQKHGVSKDAPCFFALAALKMRAKLRADKICDFVVIQLCKESLLGVSRDRWLIC